MRVAALCQAPNSRVTITLQSQSRCSPKHSFRPCFQCRAGGEIELKEWGVTCPTQQHRDNRHPRGQSLAFADYSGGLLHSAGCSARCRVSVDPCTDLKTKQGTWSHFTCTAPIGGPLMEFVVYYCYHPRALADSILYPWQLISDTSNLAAGQEALQDACVLVTTHYLQNIYRNTSVGYWSAPSVHPVREILWISLPTRILRYKAISGGPGKVYFLIPGISGPK